MSQVCHWQYKTLVSKKGKFSISYLLVQFVWEHWIILWNFWGTILRYEPKMHSVNVNVIDNFFFFGYSILFLFLYFLDLFPQWWSEQLDTVWHGQVQQGWGHHASKVTLQQPGELGQATVTGAGDHFHASWILPCSEYLIINCWLIDCIWD